MNAEELTRATLSARERYLYETLGLEHDPFAHFTAELELKVNPSDPPFYSYFVDPPFTVGASKELQSDSLIQRLQIPETSFVYGESGCGKTMLRYALDLQCRERAERALVVSLVLRASTSGESSPVQSILVEMLATDLFIQTIENFDRLADRLGPHIRQDLSAYWQATIPNFKRKVQQTLSGGAKDDLAGMSAWWWRTWKRPAIRRTPITKARSSFLQWLAQDDLEDATPVHNTSADDYATGLDLTKKIGFEQIYILVDILDTDTVTVAEMQAQLKELLDISTAFSDTMPVYVKAFLPLTIREAVESSASSGKLPLISQPFSAIMQWSEQSFRDVIRNRFRSAGSWSWESGFDALASREVANNLQQTIIESAQHSPRQLLRVISALIDAHVGATPHEPLIAVEDWKLMRRMWGYADPIPVELHSQHVEGYVMDSVEWDGELSFESKLFVEREEEFEEAQIWLAGDQQLLTIAGSPGTGKSWLMHRLEEKLASNSRIIFLTDVAQCFDKPKEPAIGIGNLNTTATINWLRDFGKTVNNNHNVNWTPEPFTEVTQLTDSLALAILARWPKSHIVLLLDGADVPAQSGWRQFERMILEPMARQSTRLRFVIAVRDNQRLRSVPLRWSETRLELSVFRPDGLPVNGKGREQVQRLLENALETNGNLNEVLNALPGYDWSHLRLNTFLVLDLARNAFSNLGDHYLPRGLSALSPMPPKTIDDALQSLLKIVESDLGDSWLVEDLAALLSKPNSEVWDAIQFLQSLWLVKNLKARNRYQITDGVRQFLQAAHAQGAGQRFT